LEKLTDLQTLDLSFNPIVHFSPLEKLTTLRRLYLNNYNKIDKQQIDQLKNSLPNTDIIIF